MCRSRLTFVIGSELASREWGLGFTSRALEIIIALIAPQSLPIQPRLSTNVNCESVPTEY